LIYNIYNIYLKYIVLIDSLSWAHLTTIHNINYVFRKNIIKKIKKNIENSRYILKIQ